MTFTVKAPLIIAKNEDGSDRYLYAGSVVPSNIASADIKRFAAEGLIEDDDPKPEGYGSQTVGELKAEIARRNEGRDPDAVLSDEGKKADLIAVLEADDSPKD